MLTTATPTRFPPNPHILFGDAPETMEEKFMRIFGNSWSRTSIRNTWCVTAPGIQVLGKMEHGEWLFTLHQYEDPYKFVEEFGTPAAETKAVHFKGKPGDKYSAISIVRELTERNLI